MRAPLLVVDVEVGKDLPALSSRRSDGRRYEGAFVLVREGGVPVGQRLVALGEDGLGPAELAGELAGLWHDGAARPAIRPPVEAPFISVVVPTAMQRRQQLVRCVRRLTKLDYPAYEVVVVDNRPEASPERARLHAELTEDSRVRVVTEPVPGSSAARNRGIAEARGEIVAFTDDDAEVDSTWLAAIAHRFAADPRTDCVTGWVFPAELETPTQVWFEFSGNAFWSQFMPVSFETDATSRYTARVLEDGVETPDRVPIFRGVFGNTGNVAVRADVLAQRGGFHPVLGAGTVARGGEDVEFLSRLLYHGHRVTLDPSVAVFHYHRSEYAALRGQMYGYGTGYTAALTAWLTSGVRHVAGLAPLAGAVVGVSRGRREARTPVGYPAELRWLQVWGLVCGPMTYLRSRLRYARRRNERR